MMYCGHSDAKGHRVLYRGDRAGILSQELSDCLSMAYQDKRVFDRLAGKCQTLRHSLADATGTPELSAELQAGFAKLEASTEFCAQPQQEKDLRVELQVVRLEKTKLERQLADHSRNQDATLRSELQAARAASSKAEREMAERSEALERALEQNRKLRAKLDEDDQLRDDLQAARQANAKLDKKLADKDRELEQALALNDMLRAELEEARQKEDMAKALNQSVTPEEPAQQNPPSDADEATPDARPAKSSAPSATWDAYYSKKKERGAFRVPGFV